MTRGLVGRMTRPADAQLALRSEGLEPVGEIEHLRRRATRRLSCHNRLSICATRRGGSSPPPAWRRSRSSTDSALQVSAQHKVGSSPSRTLRRAFPLLAASEQVLSPVQRAVPELRLPRVCIPCSRQGQDDPQPNHANIPILAQDKVHYHPPGTSEDQWPTSLKAGKRVEHSRSSTCTSDPLPPQLS